VLLESCLEDFDFLGRELIAIVFLLRAEECIKWHHFLVGCVQRVAHPLETRSFQELLRVIVLFPQMPTRQT
jgi:hypothetical protein